MSRFTLAAFVALLADQLFLVALSWAALRGAESTALTLGSVLMVAAIARATTTPLGGDAADRVGALPVLRRVHVARAVAGGLATMALLRADDPTVSLYVAAVVLGGLQGLQVAPMIAAAPELVAREDHARANAAVMAAMQIAGVVGPLAAGWLLDASSTSTTWIVAACGHALAAGVLPRGAERSDRIAPARRDVGVDPSALPAILVVIAGLYLGLMGPIQVGVPARVDAALGADPRVLGVLLAAFGIGMLGGTAWAALRTPPAAVGRHLLAALAATACGLLVVDWVSSPAPIALGLALAGAGMGYLDVVGVTWLQRAVAPSRLGRVMGQVMLAANATTPVSQLGAGWLAEHDVPLFAVGAAVVASAWILGVAHPGLRRLRQ
jgi:MFS family permease